MIPVIVKAFILGRLQKRQSRIQLKCILFANMNAFMSVTHEGTINILGACCQLKKCPDTISPYWDDHSLSLDIESSCAFDALPGLL